MKTIWKLLLIILIMNSVNTVKAQFNLVPNPSFEDTVHCPNSYGQITRAVGWNIPLDFSTADYFNACNNIGNVDVPQNVYGYEPAHTGDAYVGLITYALSLNMVSKITGNMYRLN